MLGDMMCEYGKTFAEAFEAGAEPETLLSLLTPMLTRVVTSIFNKCKTNDRSLEAADIIQDVNLFLFKKLPKLVVGMKDKPGKELYKYSATLIKNEAIRVLLEAKYVNPRIRGRRILKTCYVRLSSIDLGFFNCKAAYPIENLIETFIERCRFSDIPDVDVVLDFLIAEEPDDLEFAGLSETKYYATTRRMRQLTREIVEELPYE